jgi:DNA-binding CsgD family transcriptional regulator
VTGGVAVQAAAERARGRLAPAELDLIRACERSLEVLHVGAPAVMTELAGFMQRVLQTDRFGCYSPERSRAGWEIAQATWTGFAGNDVNGAIHAAMSHAPETCEPGYDPDRPRAEERDRVTRPRARLRREQLQQSTFLRVVLVRVRATDCDQLRVLLCDGPALLGWVGGVRSEPFTAREQRRLTAVVPALFRRFRIERLMREANLRHAGLEAALEALSSRAWGLTPRQAQVLALVARGDGNKLIAAKVGCSLRTAEIHVSNLLRKAGCETRAEVVARLARGA